MDDRLKFEAGEFLFLFHTPFTGVSLQRGKPSHLTVWMFHMFHVWPSWPEYPMFPPLAVGDRS